MSARPLSDHDLEVLRQVPELLIQMFQVQAWLTNVYYGAIPARHAGDGGTRIKLGNCRADPVTRKADIWIDPQEHASLREAVMTMRHECLHILHAEFHCVRRTAGQFIHGEQFDVLDDTYDQAAERFVCQMEMAMDHGIKGGDLDALTRAARRRLREETSP